MWIGPLDISSRVKALQRELRTNLYLSEEKGKIIIAPVVEIDHGLYQEQGDPLVLPFGSSPEHVALQAKKALLAYGLSEKAEIDKVEWPAFQASKLKSQVTAQPSGSGERG